MKTDWKSWSVEARDQRYWEALCHWPEAANWNAVHEGLDYGHLTRAFLWDKAGRAVRAATDPEAHHRELELLGKESRPAARRAPPAAVPVSWRMRLHTARTTLRRRLRGQPLMFCPFPYSRHARVIGALLERAQAFAVGVPAGYAAEWPGAVPLKVPRVAADAQDIRRAQELRQSIEKGLSALSLVLAETDRATLLQELQEQQAVLRETAATLDAVRPAAVLLPADNHFPFIEYALVARARRIPTVMLQHGLDCEHHVLDEAYASHIAVWGKDRARRYRRDSHIQPVALGTIGNPHYDHWPACDGAEVDPRLWLWVTRPHRPEKCYLPSRQPEEGMHILDALLRALESAPDCRLLIKTHPFDYEDAYRQRLQARGAPRARLVQDTVANLLRGAGVVITEDSSAGMDAMLAGRALVHAHFAASPPVVPFVAYGAARPGFTAPQLCESLALPAPGDSQHAGQQRFLDDFAGPRDGSAHRRFAEFVEEVLNRR